MVVNSIEIKNLGDSGILISLKKGFGNNPLKDINYLDQLISNQNLEEINDIVPCISTLGILYNPYKINYEELVSKLKEIIDKKLISNPISSIKKWKIPICYDQEFGLDIDEISNKLKLSIKNLINYHKQSVYQVDMIGFLPGFLYLGNLNNSLYLKRKETPRVSVPEGSIGIAGNQTGIYNLNSPGGWNIIGRTPLKLFSKYKNPPIEIKRGDNVVFYEIKKDEFEKIKSDLTK